MDPLVKIITVDGYFSQEEALRLTEMTENLNYEETEFGMEISNFNMISWNSDNIFSTVLGKKLEILEEQSGIFRKPECFIHFEGFDELNEWIFAVSLRPSTFNVFEHKSGCETALDGYQHNYRNLFEWDLTINYLLKPGQGVFFRPWLFHSFDNGLIQIFRLKEI